MLSSESGTLVSNVELYRIEQRRKIFFLKLKLRFDYRCDLQKEMKITRYGKWSKKSMRDDELCRRDLDEFGPIDA